MFRPAGPLGNRTVDAVEIHAISDDRHYVERVYLHEHQRPDQVCASLLAERTAKDAKA